MATHPGRGTATPGLLQAIARAVGAREAKVQPASVPPPEPRRSRWPRQAESHIVTLQIPGWEPAQVLVLEFPHAPDAETVSVAGALARSLERRPERPREERRPLLVGDPREVLKALSVPVADRPQALLEAVVRTFGVRAAGLALVDVEPRTWTVGPGRPALRTAALDAAKGGEGRVEVIGRRFLAVPLTWDGRTVGGLAVEDGKDSAELRSCAALLAAALRPEAEAAPETRDTRPEDDLASAVTVLPLPAVLLDSEGRLAGSSPEAERLFGLTDFDLGLPVASRLDVLGSGPALLRGEVAEDVNVGERWFEPVSAALPSGGRLILLRDRGQEEELRKSQDELVAAMSHELRTPIAGVKALLEVLRMPASRADPERAEGFLVEGLQEITRLERLVEDLLLAARVATGGIVARPDEIQIRPVVDEVMRTLHQRYPDRHFTADGEAAAMADPTLVRHAVWHLLDNAAKFGPPGSTVTVHIERSGTGAEVHVTDEGPGVFSGDLPELFQPFRRLERNATSAHGGAGIGLYLVKAVLEAQAGEIWVRSRLGKGSTFSFRLPAPA